MEALKPHITDRHLIISIVAGVKLAWLESNLTGARLVSFAQENSCFLVVVLVLGLSLILEAPPSPPPFVSGSHTVGLRGALEFEMEVFPDISCKVSAPLS